MTDKPGTRAVRTMRAQGLVNLVVRGLLRTPGLSQIIGSRLITLYVVGRKSGRRYTVPVSYLTHGDDLLIGTSPGRRQIVGSVFHLADREPYRRLNNAVCVCAGEVRASGDPAQAGPDLVIDVAELIWEPIAD